MKRCKHAHVEVSFHTTKDGEFDIREGIPKSHLGIWNQPFPGPICGYVYGGDVEEQFKELGGFFYCDEKICDKCEFYEIEENGKKIKINKRNPIDSRLRHEVFKRDGYKCVECGKPKAETNLHCDHILPVSQGGTDEMDNLQTLCEPCNLAKSNKKWKGGDDGKTKLGARTSN